MKIYFFIIALIYSCSLLVSCENRKAGTELDLEDKPKENVLDSVVLNWQEDLTVAKDEIRFFIENRNPQERYFLLDRELFSSVLIPRFYIKNDFSPAWFDKNNINLSRATEMLMYIKDLSYHGFIPEDFHIDQIDTQINKIENEEFSAKDIAYLDIYLSDAFLIIASQLYNGKVDPEAIQAEWGIQRDRPDLMLDNRLINMLNDKRSVKSFMELFYPHGMGYKSMVRKAKYFSDLNGPEKLLNIPIDSLESEYALDNVYQGDIIERLAFLGYRSNEEDTGSVKLKKLITKFQLANGLHPDGIIRKSTYKALNQPVSEKLKKLFVNMERLRWLPISPKDTLLSINIADFTLVYRKGEDTLLTSRTVVGKDFRQTPVFESKISYLVFAPTWTIPQTILKNDVLPKVVKDSNYLDMHSMRVLDRSGNRVPNRSVDWNKALKGNFPYVIRQDQGPENPLGKVKFMFPNKYSVYVHDTPSKSLFARDERTFSSGCIRMDAPMELARLLLNDSINWNEENIKSYMNSDTEKTVVLKNPVKVSIYYLTSWADASEKVHFRKDIYSRDNAVFEALQSQARRN